MIDRSGWAFGRGWFRIEMGWSCAMGWMALRRHLRKAYSKALQVCGGRGESHHVLGGGGRAGQLEGVGHVQSVQKVICQVQGTHQGVQRGAAGMRGGGW